MKENIFCFILLHSVFLLSLSCFSESAQNSFASMPDMLTDRQIASLDTMYSRERLQSFTDPLLVVRYVNSPGHDSVKQYLMDFFEKRRYVVEEDSFYDQMPNGTKFIGTNVLASTKHISPRTRRLILACHWDSLYQKDYDFIGATDSAVPCGMLLWLADALQPMFADPENRELLRKANVALQFVFFDGEEAVEEWTNTDSIYGARHLARKWQSENKLASIDLLVLLDLLGGKNPQFYSFFENTHIFFKSLGESETRLRRHWVSLYGERSKARNIFGPPMRAPGNIEDDHIPFLRRNVPILHIVPLPFPNVWHTRDDHIGNIHWPTVDRLTKVLAIFTVRQLNSLLLANSAGSNLLMVPDTYTVHANNA